MHSCPFAKPDTLLHKLVRWSIRHSSRLNRAWLKADDLLYGARPGTAPNTWLDESS
jgi:hypothetical protein